MRTSRLQVNIFRYAIVALRAQGPEAHLSLRGGYGGSLRGARGPAESLALHDLLRSFPRLQLSEWSLAVKRSHQPALSR